MELNTQQILQDAIVAHKYLIHMYCQFGLECSNKELRDMFAQLQAVASAHDFKIFQIMHEKNFYPTTPATAKDINQAIKMHTQMQTELENIVRKTK